MVWVYKHSENWSHRFNWMRALKKDSMYLKGSIMMFLIRYCYYREHVEGEINKRTVVGSVLG